MEMENTEEVTNKTIHKKLRKSKIWKMMEMLVCRQKERNFRRVIYRSTPTELGVVNNT